jgi:thioesterase domain-containing protein
MVAFEMAQQLLAQGQEIGLLAVIDTAPWSRGDGSLGAKLKAARQFLANLPVWIRHDLLQTSFSENLNRLERQILLRWRWLQKALGRGGDSVHRVGDVVDLEEIPEANHQFMEIHYKVYREYKPERYPGKVVLFKAAASPLFFTGCSLDAWRAIAREVAVCRIPGNHLSIMREPLVRIFSDALEASLKEAHLVHHFRVARHGLSFQ